MFTGVFKVSSSKPVPPSLARERFAHLLANRSLKRHRFIPQGHVGPFVVDYLCSEAGLIIELRSHTRVPDADARASFLSQMGYRVLCVTAKDLAHPHALIRRIHAAMRG